MRSTQVWNRSRLRYLLSVPVFIIVLLNIELISQIKDFNTLNSEKNVGMKSSNLSQNKNVTNTQSIFNSSQKDQSLHIKIKKLNSELSIRNKHLIESFLKNEIQAQNNANKTINIGSKTSTIYKMPKFFVILIQVHSRFNYLKELINSLKETKFIDQALVVFSHDIFNEEMNTLINSIDFCAVIKHFFLEQKI